MLVQCRDVDSKLLQTKGWSARSQGVVVYLSVLTLQLKNFPIHGIYGRKLLSTLITQMGGATQSRLPVTPANNTLHYRYDVSDSISSILVKILVFRKPYYSGLLNRSRQSIHISNPGNRHKTRVKYDNLHTFPLVIRSPKVLRVKRSNCKYWMQVPLTKSEKKTGVQADFHKRERCIFES